MDDKVTPEVQNAVENEGKEKIAKDDIAGEASEGTAINNNVDVKEEVSEKQELKEETVQVKEVKKESTVTERRRPQQQNEEFQKKRMYFRKKVCRLCSQKATSVDYKNVDLLRRYITDRGKILPRRITGNCAKHQRMLARAIKRARMAALLPFVSK